MMLIDQKVCSHSAIENANIVFAPNGYYRIALILVFYMVRL